MFYTYTCCTCVIRTGQCQLAEQQAEQLGMAGQQRHPCSGGRGAGVAGAFALARLDAEQLRLRDTWAKEERVTLLLQVEAERLQSSAGPSQVPTECGHVGTSKKKGKIHIVSLDDQTNK